MLMLVECGVSKKVDLDKLKLISIFFVSIRKSVTLQRVTRPLDSSRSNKMCLIRLEPPTFDCLLDVFQALMHLHIFHNLYSSSLITLRCRKSILRCTIFKYGNLHIQFGPLNPIITYVYPHHV